jgi:purine-binding chemotaxis protein CheW
MTEDDERMDRARRIREMREGSRPQDEESSDDQSSDSTADAEGTETADETDALERSAEADSDTSDDAGATDDAEASDTVESDSDTAAATTPDGGDATADSDPGEATDEATDNAETTDAETTDGSETTDDTPDGDGVQTDDRTEAADDTDEESVDAPAAGSDGSDDGTIHVPGTDVEDVNVDVEEMARQAGLTSADESDAAGDEAASGEADDAGSAVTGAANRAAESESETAEETRVLEFTLGDEQYCLDIEYVEEIVKRETVTRVPNTPDYVEGVVDLRGQITTILDPKELLDIDTEGEKELIVVFDPEGFEDQGAIGWIVDEVTQVTPVVEDEVNDSPVDEEYINGVVERDEEFVIWTEPGVAIEHAAG